MERTNDAESARAQARETQSNPALAAIQKLDDDLKASFDVVERNQSKLREETHGLVKGVRDDIEATKTAQDAGFTHLQEKVHTLERRSIAVWGGGRDRDSCFLAALGDEEKKSIPVLDWMMAGRKKDERLPMFSSSVGSTLIAHWLMASLNLQKRIYSTQEEQQSLWSQIARYEKAICEAYQIEKAATMITTTPALGGHLLPDPVAAELYRLIIDNSIIGSMCTHVPMTTKTLDLPTEGSQMTVNWNVETSQAIADSVPAAPFGVLNLSAARLNGRAVVSLETIQDAAISVLSWVQTKLTELCGRQIDIQALEGTGAGAATNQPFTGLSNAVGVNELTATGATGDALTYALLAKIPYKARERSSREGAQWAMAPEMMAKVVGLADTAGMPVYQFANVPNAIPERILGYPVQVHSAIKIDRAKGASGNILSWIYFGPFKQIVIGDRMGMSWDVSDIPGFSTADVHMRLITRLAIGVPVPGAFTRAIDLIAT